MKKVLLLITCLFVIGFAAAQQVSVEDAQVVASSYFGEKATRGSQNQLKLVYTQLSSDGSKAEDMYVFNNGNDNGFVIVAGDMRASSLIVGYCDTGSFDKDNIPSNMSWWLSEYARQIDYLRENVAEVKVARARAGIKAGSAVVKVYPLLGATAWNQYEPYNNMTPVVDGGQCVTGCIATAMAQIMYFHKWPKVGKGTHTNRYDNTLTVDFSKSKYRWDNMCDTYEEGSYTMMQGYAVAKLMYDCGIAVDMQYASDGSGAFTEDVPNAFQTYFDYSADMELKYRTTQTDWDDMIKKELEAKRPIYYSSQADEDGGHAFVCDGYQIDGGKSYFHINWGWGGIGNCYCLTSLLDCGGTYFNMNQMMLIGIKANNKVRNGSYYYNLLSDSKVQFTFPSVNTEYKGDIAIPAQITISGTNYDVTSINSSAFSGCNSVTSVDIPTSISKIGGGAFTNCSGIKTIKVNWTENIPDILTSAFSYDVFNKATLIVPDGMVETYSSTMPWRLFSTIKDSQGVSVEYGEWIQFGEGKGVYKYERFFSGADTLAVMARSKKLESENYVLLLDNWLNDMPLFINYDSSTNKCQVPIQKIIDSITYTDEEGEKTGALYIADVPTYVDNTEYCDQYPSTYNPATGIFSLNVAYFTAGVLFGYGVETFQMIGDFLDLSVEISGVTDIVENEDKSASQKFTLQGTEDVDKFKYTVVEGILSDDEIKDIAQGIADGTVASESKTNGVINIVSANYPQPGNYTFIVITVDSEDKYYGNYAYKSVSYQSSKEWKDIAKGTYKYSLYFSGESKNLTLSRNISDTSKWKISNAFKGVDFIFNWDETTDMVTFGTQMTGATHSTYGNVYVSNYCEYFDDGDCSYFDRANDTFNFNVVYNVGDGYFPSCVGVETFYVPNILTDITHPKSEVNCEEPGARSYNLAGQIVGENYKGIVINNGKKYLKK